MFLFNPGLGLVSHFLGVMGYSWNHAQNSGQAMFLVVLASVWKQVSYNFLFSLRRYSQSPSRCLRLLPLMAQGRFGVSFILSFPDFSSEFLPAGGQFGLCVFDTFPVIDAATGGGPGQSTTTLIYKIYREGFAGLDLSSSAAQSVVLMLIVVALTMIQFRYVERKVRYQ